MSTQRAWYVPHTGTRDVLEISEFPVPTPAATEVLVKNEYGGLNFIEMFMRSGDFPIPTPYIAGTEASGTIVSVGDEVTRFKVGDRVVHGQTGAFAEYTAVPLSAYIAVIPDDIDFIDATALALQGLTALTLIEESYKVQRDDYILVQAAAGGMGLTLTQLISHRGAHVIGTVSTEEKAKIAKAAGAEHVIIYTKEDYVAKVKEITGGVGVNAVFDGVGKSTFDGSFDSLARKGTFVTFGNSSGPVPLFNLSRLTSKNIKIIKPTLFQYMTTPEECDHYFNLLWDSIRQQVIKAQVYKIYPFEEYVAAAEALEERKSTGKVLLKISK